MVTDNDQTVSERLSCIWWLLKEPLLLLAVNSRSLLAAGVFGHSFGSFTDSVFRQFTGEKKPDGGLDLAGADG